MVIDHRKTVFVVKYGIFFWYPLCCIWRMLIKKLYRFYGGINFTDSPGATLWLECACQTKGILNWKEVAYVFFSLHSEMDYKGYPLYSLVFLIVVIRKLILSSEWVMKVMGHLDVFNCRSSTGSSKFLSWLSKMVREQDFLSFLKGI